LYGLFPDKFEYFSAFRLEVFWGYITDVFATGWMNGVGLVLVLGVLGVAYFFFPVIADAAVISSVHHLKKDPDLKLGFWRSLWVGMKGFVPLIEYDALTAVFDISKLITVIYLLMKFIGPSEVLAFWPVFLVAACFMLFFSVLLVYGRYNVVIENGKVIKSIQKSVTLVAFYLHETFLLLTIVGFFVLLVLLYTALYLAFPVGIVFVFEFLLRSFNASIALYIGGGVAVIMYVIFAKLVGFAHVFLATMWTLTFMDLNERKEHQLLED
jgi:hypothetical protein